MIRKKKILILIPSRLRSKRLENKSIRMILRKPMIVRVVEQAIKLKMGKVVVAAGDKKIKNLLDRYKIESYLSKKTHKSGTDRIYEIYKNFFGDYNIIVNLQGDMPYFEKELVEKTVELLECNKTDIGTAACNLDEKDLKNPNVVKVKVNFKNNRGIAKDFTRKIKSIKQFYHHIGIYVFRPKSLTNFIMCKQSFNEKERSLEQMRALDNDMIIKVSLLNSKPIGVDTKEDLREIRIFLKDKKNKNQILQ